MFSIRLSEAKENRIGFQLFFGQQVMGDANCENKNSFYEAMQRGSFLRTVGHVTDNF